MEYRRLAITGIYMGRESISPFGLYVSSIWRNNRRDKSGNPDVGGKHDVRLVRSAVCSRSGNPLLIVTETLIQEESASEFEEKTHGRGGCGGKWINGNVCHQYGMLRHSRIRKAPVDDWLEDGEMGAVLGGMGNMFDRNQMACRYCKCVCERLGEFAIGEEVAQSLMNGRNATRASIDVAEIRRRAEGAQRNRDKNGASVRIAGGWRCGGFTDNDKRRDAARRVRSGMTDAEFSTGWNQY